MLQLKSFFQERSYQKYKMWFNECSILKNCLRTLENKYYYMRVIQMVCKNKKLTNKVNPAFLIVCLPLTLQTD